MKETTDVLRKGIKEGVSLIKKAWSIMDAASEKKTPTEFLSPKAVSKIQGQ